MDHRAEKIVEAACHGADARFSRWDPEIFDEVARPAINALSNRIDLDADDARKVVESYATLLVEGVGQGYIQRRTSQTYGALAWANLLSFLFVDIVPWNLGRYPLEDGPSML